MTEHDHTAGNSWTEYRLLVTAMLERHDEELNQLERGLSLERDHARELVNGCEGRMRDLVDEKFVQLGDMHRRQVETARREFSEQIKEKEREATQVKVAKITGTWQFWGLVIVQISSVIIALIALLKP